MPELHYVDLFRRFCLCVIVLASLDLQIKRLEILTETVNPGVYYLALASTKYIKKPKPWTFRDYGIYYAVIP